MPSDDRTSEDNDSDTSDHEEEFYYTEIEVTVDTMTQSFAGMYTSSPPDVTPFTICGAAPPDHDYLKKKVCTLWNYSFNKLLKPYQRPLCNLVTIKVLSVVMVETRL